MSKSGFDSYTAALVTAITGPFIIWGLLVVIPYPVISIILAVAILVGVFLAFGRIRVE